MNATVLSSHSLARPVSNRDSRNPLPRWLALFAAGLLCSVHVGRASQPEVSTYGQFNGLSAAAAGKALSVRIKGTVLCYDAEWNQLFIQDRDGAFYLSPEIVHRKLKPGQYVQITATTAAAAGKPILTNLSVSVTGRKSLPKAKAVELARLAATAGQWIETSAQVRVADTSRGRLTLWLQDQSQTCLAYVMGTPATSDVKCLLGAKVRVRGVNTTSLVAGRLREASLLVPSTNEIAVLEPSPIHAAELPVLSIESLLTRELGDWTNQLVHINGTVVAYQPGAQLVVKDPTGALRAQVVQTTPAQVDERVDVWGYLALFPTEPVLQPAYFEIVHSLAPESPTPREPAPTTAAGTNETTPEALTQIADVLALHRDEAARGLSVRLSGLITYADNDWHNAFLQAQGEAVFLNLSRFTAQPGEWIEVTGQTAPGTYAPVVLANELHSLAVSNLPAPVRAELEDLADGRLDSRWLELRGVVRRVSLDWGHLYLNLTTRQGRFNVIVPGFRDKPIPTELIDALVSVQGACGSEANSRGQLDGIVLFVPTLEQLQILEPAPPDPFAAARTAIESVATFDPDRLSGRRIKVSGVVTLLLPGQGFFMQDATGGLRIHTQQTNQIHSGDVVDVLGFPAFGDFSPRLEEASYRILARQPWPSPRKTTAEQILLGGTNDAMVVRLEARLLQRIPHAAQPKLVLQDGPIIFTANLATHAATPQIYALEPGSLLRLTGVCSIQGSERHEPAAFRLLLPHPDSIQLLAAPPAWSARRTLLLAAGLAVAIILTLAWVGLLRRQVRRQTEVIRHEKNLLATLVDHLPDNVYVKDLKGRYLLTNRSHSQFHGAAASRFVGKSVFDLFPEDTARQYAAADEKVLAGGLEVFNAEEPARKGDGQLRCLSTKKVPLKDSSGAIIGLVGISRDITESKEAEALLAYERDLLTYLLDNCPDAIYFKDLNSGFVRVSRYKLESSFAIALSRHRLADPTGAETLPDHLADLSQFASYLIGKTDFDFYDEPRARSAFEDEQQIIRTAIPIIGKVEATHHPDGHKTWCLTTKLPWRDKSGQIVGTFGISRDITPIKEAEEKLEAIHKQLIETSRQAGMAEVATGVLHNVGNVLNSVNVSTSLLAQHLQQSKVANLAKAVALLREHAHDLGPFLSHDPKGRHLAGYLDQLAQHLAQEQNGFLTELASLAKNVEHIKTIVAMQQSYAKVVGITETVQASDLVEDALRLNEGALARHQVQIVRDFDPAVPPLAVDKHKVLQVLVNLIRNAKYACDESHRPDKCLTVRIANGDQRVSISVCDNGVGIPTENLTRIFSLGFSTRRDGHGFGLHSGALAARELGGTLVAHSAGPGLGATFTLDLPVEPITNDDFR